MKLLFIVNDVSFFISHRLQIGLEAVRQGYEVHLAAPGTCPEDLRDTGFVFHSIELARKGMNPLQEIKSLLGIVRLMRKLKPNLVHAITIKPVVYGGVAARLLRIPLVAAVPGLGFAFSGRGALGQLLQKLIRWLYLIALGGSRTIVIFQNEDDQQKLIGTGVVKPNSCVLIRGSGVSLSEYPTVPESEGAIVFSMASRLLKEKGVQEFVGAAHIVTKKGIKAKFQIIGAPDPGNPSTITAEQLEDWKEHRNLAFLGFRADIADLFAKSHVVVLPSYYGEGLPKVLLEAAACSRAVITTDHPGCRDAIISEETGILVPIRDEVALADAMERLAMDADLRQRMGRAGRELVESEFSVERVVDEHMAVYEQLLQSQ